MKILHVTETGTGGVASYLNMMCEVDPNDQNIILVPDRMAKGIDPAHDIRTYETTGRNLAAVWSMIRATRRMIRKEKPDVVFFQASFSLLALTAMRLSGIRLPFIYCSHGWSAWIYPDGSLKQRIVRLVEGTLGGLADRVLNISEADLKLARDNGYFGRHVLIPNAVPDRVPEVNDSLFADTPDRLHVLFVGRMDRQKGLDLLLPAFAKAREARPDLELHIVGSAIRQDGAEAELPEGASLAGWVDKAHIDDWYASADVLVVPSRWESFGLVVAEALRNGTPVLVSDRGALPSLFDKGVHGDVFELTEPSMVAALTALDKEELRRRRPACRALYEERHAFPRLAADISALYAEVVAERSGS
jgi:glycosyltransferase involved in cell wall biosynthesis